MTPRRPLLIAAAALAFGGLLAALIPSVAEVWPIAALLLAAAATIDAISALTVRPPTVERELPG